MTGFYRFVTIKPGAYPWRNHVNAWRPAHVHFSLFGPYLASRLVTQMYFPGDPLIPLDPILRSIPDPRGRDLLIARFDLDTTVPEWALGYRWDIVLRGAAGDADRAVTAPTPSQTVGPFFGFALPFEGDADAAGAESRGAIRVEGQVLDGAGEPVTDALIEAAQGDQFARCRTDGEGAFHISLNKPAVQRRSASSRHHRFCARPPASPSHADVLSRRRRGESRRPRPAAGR